MTHHTLHERQQADDELAMLIEQEELALGQDRPVPRKELDRRARTALWALRIFVIVVGVMVVYTFFAQLGS
jgi:hypothetical protein